MDWGGGREWLGVIVCHRGEEFSSSYIHNINILWQRNGDIKILQSYSSPAKKMAEDTYSVDSWTMLYMSFNATTFFCQMTNTNMEST